MKADLGYIKFDFDKKDNPEDAKQTAVSGLQINPGSSNEEEDNEMDLTEVSTPAK